MKCEIETELCPCIFANSVKRTVIKWFGLRITPNLQKILFVSGAVFFVSLMALGTLGWFLFNSSGDDPTSIPNPGSGQGSTFLVYALITSIVTSLGSAVTFVSTFALAWRKEGREKQKEVREQEAFFLDNERKKLENERLVLEINEMKKRGKKKTRIVD